jgi:Flp pilus assembly protein TadG
MKHRQRGLAAVEFAIVGTFAAVTLFAAMEVGRVLYVMNAVGEATRRGARVAVVSDAAAARAAVLVYGITGLTEANVAVDYLNEAGGAPTTPGARAFVRVQIVDYTVALAIPVFNLQFAVPAFTTTLPVESMGFVPD